MKALKAKKCRLERDVDQFEEEADQLALDGERKSNCMETHLAIKCAAKKIKEHRERIHECDEELIKKKRSKECLGLSPFLRGVLER